MKLNVFTYDIGLSNGLGALFFKGENRFYVRYNPAALIRCSLT